TSWSRATTPSCWHGTAPTRRCTRASSQGHSPRRSDCRAWTTLDCVAGCAPRSRAFKPARCGAPRRLASLAHARPTQPRRDPIGARSADRQNLGMQFGVVVATGDPRTAADLAAEAEAAGWDGVFTWDGIAIGAGEAFDPWVVLAAMAMRTERVRLG